MADVTPVIPAGRQVIETYGENRFHVSGVRYVHSLLVLPEEHRQPGYLQMLRQRGPEEKNVE